MALEDLTDKQRLFVEYYIGVANWNASKAARLAGYSVKADGDIGWENLKKPEIAEAIKQRIAEVAMSANEVLLRLADHARSDLGDFIDEEGRLDLVAAREQGKLHLVREYQCEEVIEGGDRDRPPDYVRKRRVKLVDSQAALVTLGKHHKLWTEKLEATGRDGGPIEMNVRAVPVMQFEQKVLDHVERFQSQQQAGRLLESGEDEQSDNP